jgi:signal peptidase I
VSPWVATAVIVVTISALVIVLARSLLLVVTVAGGSMEPTLRPGDRVLVRRRRAPVQVGDILVFRDPYNQRVIKRVAAIAGDAVPASVRLAAGGTELVPAGMLVLLGDGIRSSDSRQWGLIRADQVLGQMIGKLPG